MYHWSDIPKGCCLLISSTEKDHRIMNPFLARSCKKFYQSLMHENPQSLAIKLADRGNSRGWARQIGTVPLGGSDSFTLHTTWHTTWMTQLLDHGPNQNVDQEYYKMNVELFLFFQAMNWEGFMSKKSRNMAWELSCLWKQQKDLKKLTHLETVYRLKFCFPVSRVCFFRCIYWYIIATVTCWYMAV